MAGPDRLTEAIELHQQGALGEAAQLYQEVLDADPENADAWHLLGVAAHQQGKNDLALSLITNAIGLNGEVADFHNNLGQVNRALGEDETADKNYRRALEINPAHVKALNNLAGLLRTTGQFSAAVDYARRAVQAGPEDPETHNNLGNALKDVTWLEDAVQSYRRAIALRPDYALAHWNLSLALLSLGQYEEGFQEMRWRWRWAGFPARAREFAQPHMEDEAELTGKTVLLHAEQGLGDTIHFIRYAALLRQNNMRVVFECPGALMALLEGTDLVDELVCAGDALPEFDAHAALLDLPALLQNQTSPLPAEMPYLAVPTPTADKWRDIVNEQPGYKVGLNWSGNPKSPVEKFRALPPDELNTLAELQGVTWFSLQKAENQADVPALPTGFPIIDTGPEALVETAGLIQTLDLVITSDTAIAHLAGALGKPVWVLLHHAPDWRWQSEGRDSSWYPRDVRV